MGACAVCDEHSPRIGEQIHNDRVQVDRDHGARAGRLVTCVVGDGVIGVHRVVHVLRQSQLGVLARLTGLKSLDERDWFRYFPTGLNGRNWSMSLSIQVKVFRFHVFVTAWIDRARPVMHDALKTISTAS